MVQFLVPKVPIISLKLLFPYRFLKKEPIKFYRKSLTIEFFCLSYTGIECLKPSVVEWGLRPEKVWISFEGADIISYSIDLK